MTVEGEGEQQTLKMTTDMGESFFVDEQHPLRIIQEGQEWIPYVLVRDGMEGRLNRNVYYQLADLLQASSHPDLDEQWLGVWSCSQFFSLMAV